MRNRKLDKKHANERRQFKLWRQWKRDSVKQLLTGPYAAATNDLLQLLRSMPPSSVLLKAIELGPWHNAGSDTRAVIFSLINWSIVRHRESRCLTPFDDPLPGEPDNASLRIRALLMRDPS